MPSAKLCSTTQRALRAKKRDTTSGSAAAANPFASKIISAKMPHVADADHLDESSATEIPSHHMAVGVIHC